MSTRRSGITTTEKADRARGRRAAVSANNELPAEERLEIVPNDRNGETCDRCGEVEED